MIRRLREIDSGYLLVTILSLAAVAPLTAPAFFLKAHDATIGAYFLWQFEQALRDGALYPRWAMDWTFGYGYPVFAVIAPLAFYLGSAFRLLGAGILDSLKLVYGLAFLASGLAMYLYGRAVFGRAGGLLAAVLYVYIPYHLVDIYVRGDVAEFVAFAFFPAVLWALLRISRARSGRELAAYAALGALLYGGLILTHITMGLLLTPVAILYGLWLTWRGRARARLAANAVVCLLGLGVAAAFLLPALAEQRYIRSEQLTGAFFGYANHFVYPQQLFSPFWGYGYAGIGPLDAMPYQLGLAALALAAAGLWGLQRMAAPQRGHTLFFLAIMAAVIFFMLPVSQLVWDVFSRIVSFIQFPWRLLALTSLALAMLGGAAAAGVARRVQDAEPLHVVAPLLVVVLLGSYAYSTPQYADADLSLAHMVRFQLNTKEMLGDTVWVTERPTGSPMVTQYLAGQPPQRAVPADPNTAVTVLHAGGASYEVMVRSAQAGEVLFLIRYYPGWRVYVDGAAVEPAIRPPQGLMAVQLPAGEHRVLLRFGDTPLRAASKGISLLSLAVAAFMLYWAGRCRPAAAMPPMRSHRPRRFPH